MTHDELVEKVALAIAQSEANEIVRSWHTAQARAALAVVYEAMKELMDAAFLAGFNASGEGWNGEYPFNDNDIRPENNKDWAKLRDCSIAAMLDASALRPGIDRAAGSL